MVRNLSMDFLFSSDLVLFNLSEIIKKDASQKEYSLKLMKPHASIYLNYMNLRKKLKSSPFLVSVCPFGISAYLQKNFHFQSKFGTTL